MSRLRITDQNILAYFRFSALWAMLPAGHFAFLWAFQKNDLRRSLSKGQFLQERSDTDNIFSVIIFQPTLFANETREALSSLKLIICKIQN